MAAVLTGKTVYVQGSIILPGHTRPGKRDDSAKSATKLAVLRELCRISQRLQLHTGSTRERNDRQVGKVEK